MKISSTLLLLGALATAPLLADAEKPAEKKNFLTQDALTGDWGGARTFLSDHGFDLSLVYTAGVHGNPVGGIAAGAYYNGLLNFGIDLDFDKMMKWSGGSFHANGMWIHGTNGTAAFVGDAGGYNNIYNDPTVRLYSLWLQQNLLQDKLSIRIGSLAADDEFFVTEMGALFLNSGFGTTPVLSQNMPVPIFAIPALGLRVRVNPSPFFWIQAAIWDGNPDPDTLGDKTPGFVAGTNFNRSGFGFKLAASEGIFGIAEIGFKVNPVEEGVAPKGPRGIYKLGFAFHSDEFTDAQDLGSASSSAKGVLGNWALYLAAEQILVPFAGVEDGGIGLFGRVAYAPVDRNKVSLGAEGGLLLRGLFGRAYDRMGLGLAWYDIGTAYAAGVKSTGAAAPHSELTLEMSYLLQLTPYLSLQPDVQYIVHVGASPSTRNALVLGIRGSLSL